LTTAPELYAVAKKNLIVGTIMHYDFDRVEPFFSSLSSTKYSGDIVLFYSDVPLWTIKLLRRKGAILIPFERSFPHLEPSLAKHACRKATVYHSNHLEISRWLTGSDLNIAEYIRTDATPAAAQTSRHYSLDTFGTGNALEPYILCNSKRAMTFASRACSWPDQ
jgi:hypothetical protein